MAKQKGVIKLDGTIGDITFYKSQDGFLAKGKSGVPAARIKNDPAFQRTRENGSEFGRAGKAGKVLRKALRNMIQNASDSRLVSRLTKQMMRVIQMDETSTRGERNVIDGEVELLLGFDFNINGRLGSTFYAPFTATIDRPNGKLTVSIPPFTPINAIAAPGGATHYRVVSAGAEIDFENETFKVDSQSLAILPIDGGVTLLVDLQNLVTPANTHPLFIVLGIEFYQQVNGQNYSLRNGAFNALSIVKVDGGV